MQITGTHINYYFSCHRQLWLFANGIQMELHHNTVEEGKLIHETAYSDRPAKYEEIELDGIKIDFFDTKNNVIHEIKKSSKLHDAHRWQLKYYMYVFWKNGMKNISGILEYPKERKTEEVYLSSVDIEKIKEMETEIKKIIESKKVPATIDAPRCKKCAYYDFCYVRE